MAPVHWIIQENQGDSESVRRVVQALEADRHVPHLVWLTKGLDVPPIPDLPDDAPIVCYGQGFVTRALHHPRLKPGLFFDPEKFRWSVFCSGWEGAMLSSDGGLAHPFKATSEGALPFSRFVREGGDFDFPSPLSWTGDGAPSPLTFFFPSRFGTQDYPQS